MNRQNIFIGAVFVLSIIFYVLAIPECANNETLVRGMFWFECV